METTPSDTQATPPSQETPPSETPPEKDTTSKKTAVIVSVVLAILIVVVIVVVVLVVEKKEDDTPDPDSDSDESDEEDLEDSLNPEDPPVPTYLPFDDSPFLGIDNAYNDGFVTREVILYHQGVIRYGIRRDNIFKHTELYVTTPYLDGYLVQYILNTSRYRFFITLSGRLVIVNMGEQTETGSFRLVNCFGYATAIRHADGTVRENPEGHIDLVSTEVPIDFSNTIYIDIHVPPNLIAADLYVDNTATSQIVPDKRKMLTSMLQAHYFFMVLDNVLYILDLNLGQLAGIVRSRQDGFFSVYNRGFFEFYALENSSNTAPGLSIENVQQATTSYPIENLYTALGFAHPVPAPQDGAYNVTLGWSSVSSNEEGVLSWTPTPENTRSTDASIFPLGTLPPSDADNRVGYLLIAETQMEDETA